MVLLVAWKWLLLLAGCSCLRAVQSRTEAFLVPEDMTQELRFLSNANAGKYSRPPHCFYKYTNDSVPGTWTQPAQKLNISQTAYHDLLRNTSQSRLVITVEVLKLQQLVYVNERDKSIKLSLRIRKTWNDCRIRWQSKGGESFTIATSEFSKFDVYHPHLRAPEALSGILSQENQYYISVSNAGEVTIYYEMPIELSCSIDVRMYPFDIHLCSLTFELSSALKGIDFADVSANFKSVSLFQSYVASDVWAVTMVPEACPFVPNLCTSDGDECRCKNTRYSITLRRMPYYQLTNLLMPAFFIALTSSCVFLVPPNAGDKMELNLSILLSLYMFCQLMYDKMPETGSTLPLLSQYFLVCLGLVTASCLYSAVSAAAYQACPSVPSFLRRFVARMAPFLIPDMIERAKLLPSAPNHTETSKAAALSSNCGTYGKVDRDREQTEVSSDAIATATEQSEADTNLVDERRNSDFVGFRIDNPETLTWAAVGALFDRVFFVVHLLANVVFLLYFITQGYLSWLGYSGERNLITPFEMKHMCRQLFLQGAKYDDLPCEGLIPSNYSVSQK